jgi:hypothetical protein
MGGVEALEPSIVFGVLVASYLSRALCTAVVPQTQTRERPAPHDLAVNANGWSRRYEPLF